MAALKYSFSSVQFSHSVMSDSLHPHGLQHTRLPYSSPRSLLKLIAIQLVMPSNELIRCCPLLLLPSVFSSIRVFSNESTLLIRWLKYWTASASVLSMNIQDWFPLGQTGLISLQSKGLSRTFTSNPVQKHQFCRVESKPNCFSLKYHSFYLHL